MAGEALKRMEGSGSTNKIRSCNGSTGAGSNIH